MTVLTIVNDAQRRLNLAVSSSVVGNADETTTEMLALLNQAGEEYAEVYPWQVLTKEATFTTLAAESQGAITTIAPGFFYVLNQTIWNRSQNRPIFGPLSPREWQRIKSSSVTGPYHQYRIRANLLRLIPTPAAGETCAFEYISKNWCTTSDGVTEKSAFTIDTDVSLLNERMLTLSLIWRFKQAKGLDFTAELAIYESRLANEMARDGGKPVINMGGMSPIMPGLVIPEGSWSL